MSGDYPFLLAIHNDPQDVHTRGVFLDWLDDHDRSTWETVRGYVCAQPHSDGLRLLAADWCERNGEKDRAEFVRVQMETARYPQQIEWLRQMPVEQWIGPAQEGHTCVFTPCPVCTLVDKYKAMQRRQHELLESMQPGVSPAWSGSHSFAMYVWSEPLAKLLKSNADAWSFRRGFIASVRCPWRDWLRHGPSVVKVQPVEEVGITSVIGQYHALPSDWLYQPYPSLVFWQYGLDAVGRSLEQLLAEQPGWLAYRDAWAFREALDHETRLVDYPSVEEAMKAFGRACVAWARRVAGLPEVRSSLTPQHAG